MYPFIRLSISLPQSEKESVKLAPFYSWFETAVDRWLDIALYKAMIRIGKAVSLDNLQTVDSIVRHSSSAVDAVSVFYSVRFLLELFIDFGNLIRNWLTFSDQNVLGTTCLA